MRGWRPGSGPDLDQVVDWLRGADLEVVGRLPWSSNLTYVVTVGAGATGVPAGPASLEGPYEGDGAGDEGEGGENGGEGGESDGAGDDSQGGEGRDEGGSSTTGNRDGDSGPEPLYAVYKPGGGERSLWDFPDNLFRREVAAYALSEALGWGLVPPTVERDDGPFGPGSLQLLVDADYSRHYFPLLEEGECDAALRAVCTFDVVANNADRKSGHVLQGPDGRIWAIDHGLCFHWQPKLRTVIWDYADEPVPEDLLNDLSRRASELPRALAHLLSEREVAALLMRVTDLTGSGVFPEPDRDGPPYPWPLV